MTEKQIPPPEIYYFEGGGKTGPFYVAVKGIRSAFKTSCWSRSFKYMNKDQVQEKRRVWKGTVIWIEVTEEVAPTVEELMSR
jgi:hypothetical protein